MVQFSSVQFSSVQFSSVQFSSVQFGSVQFGSVQFGSVQFGSVQFGSVQLGTFRPEASLGLDCPHLPLDGLPGMKVHWVSWSAVQTCGLDGKQTLPAKGTSMLAGDSGLETSEST